MPGYRRKFGRLEYLGRFFGSGVIFWRLVGTYLWQEKVERPFFGDEYVAARAKDRNRKAARSFARSATAMGGLLIKLGQFFSIRVDLLPEEAIEELAVLQDSIPPTMDMIALDELFEQELGRKPLEIFSYFNYTPIASASLGQVYRGTLHDGSTVAVKVLRPFIDKIIKADLLAFRWALDIVGSFISFHKTFDSNILYEEFRRTFTAELDYIAEGRNCERIKDNYSHEKQLHFPDIYWEYTTKKILTMSYIDGFKITDIESMDTHNIDRKKVAEIIVRTYLKMIFVDGFFHADPHPGNFFVMPDNSVTLIDFGMVGEFSPQVRGYLREGFIAIVKKDIPILVRSLINLGFISPKADVLPLERALDILINKYYSYNLRDFQNMDITNLTADLRSIIYTEDFRVPGYYAFLGRAIGTIVGLSTKLDPNINLIELAAPYAQEFIEEDESILRRLWREGRSLVSFMLDLPMLTKTTLEKVNRGEIEINNENSKLIASIERLRGDLHMIYLFVFYLLLGIGTYLLYTNQYIKQPVMIGFAVVLGLHYAYVALKRRNS